MHSTKTLLPKLSDPSALDEQQTAHSTLYKFICTASGHGFIDMPEEKEGKEEKKDETSIRSALQTIKLATLEKLGEPIATAFHIALRSIDLDNENLIAISKNLKMTLDHYTRVRAETLTCVQICKFFKDVVVPTGIIEEEKLPTTPEKLPTLLALKSIKTAIKEIIAFDDAYLDLEIEKIPEDKEVTPEIRLIGDALNGVDLEKEDALEKAFIALNHVSIKMAKEKEEQLSQQENHFNSFQAVLHALKEYEFVFLHSRILWEYKETIVLKKIRSLNNSLIDTEEKCKKTGEIILSCVKKIPPLEQSKQKPLTSQKVLIAIYYALTQKPRIKTKEVIHSILKPSIPSSVSLAKPKL